jgi:2-isopropylmalate synthase
VLGKHSGRHALRQRFQKLGYDLDKAELDQVYAQFTALADRKKNILDDDLLDLLHTGGGETAGFQLDSVELKSGAKGCQATVTLTRNDQPLIGAATGADTIAAVCAAVDAAAGTTGQVTSYQIKSGVARVQVEVSADFDGFTGGGSAEDTDPVTAAAAAYLRAVNRVVRHYYQKKRAASAKAGGVELAGD